MKKIFDILIIVWALLICAIVARAHAANLCTLTGNLTLINGNAGAGSSVQFTTPNGPPQNVQGTIVPFSTFSVTADANGNLPAGVNLPYSAVAQVQICASQNGTFQCGQPVNIQVPDQPTADISTLYLAQADPPSLCTAISCTGCSSVINPPPGSAGICSITVSGGGGGSGFPLSSNVSANGYLINSLGTDASTGDALSRNQSTLNSLAVPTSSVSMNSQRLTSVGAVTTTGDALSEGACIGCVAQSSITGNAIQANGNYWGQSQTLAETTGTLSPTHPSLLGGPDVLITIADNSNFTIANPTGVGLVATSPALHWWIRIVNSSGGSAGTITLGTAYEADSTWGAPATGMTRICPVLTAYNGSAEHTYIGVCTGDLTY